MGCVSSKIMSRTGSFREELSRSLKGRHHVLQGLLISASTNDGADQFIVICKDGEEDKPTKTISVQSDHLNPPQTINTWDLMKGLDETEEKQGQKEETIIVKRSQSFNGFSSDYEKSSSNGIIGSRSFHTVEEFDTIMVERRNGFSETWEDELDQDFLTRITANGVEETSSNAIVSANGNSINCEKGLRRKKMAKELTSLEIPCSIEFPVAAKNTEGLQAVKVDYYYETPKFGSYGLPVIPPSNREEEQEEEPVFDQEFLSAFHLAMEQLEAEEDFILKQSTS